MKRTTVSFLAILLGTAVVSAADIAELQAALKEAQQLAKDGKFAEALDKHVWYHENSRNTPQAGGRLSFAMMYWKSLGEKFPPAKEKLQLLGADAEKSLLDGRGGFIEFTEVSAINRTLGGEDKTRELFIKLADTSPETAKKCVFAARDTLLKHKDYALYLKFAPPPDRLFGIWVSKWQVEISMPNEQARKMTRELSLKEFRGLIEALVATDQMDKALELQRKAVALTDEKSLENTVEEAKKKVAQK